MTTAKRQGIDKNVRGQPLDKCWRQSVYSTATTTKYINNSNLSLSTLLQKIHSSNGSQF